MEWRDNGIILSVRPHGESAAIVDLLTRNKGRHSGMVRGGMSKRMRGLIQPGNEVHAVWRARLEDHLGNYTLDADRVHIGDLLDQPAPLAALTSACALSVALLPEREAHEAAYDGLRVLLETLSIGDVTVWPMIYLEWEMGILKELGFGLDLSACAATGVTEELVYVSPKTGRAVSREAGFPYHDKLLTLPQFLLHHRAEENWSELARGFDLTAFFLERFLEGHGGKDLPDARRRLPEKIRKQFS